MAFLSCESHTEVPDCTDSMEIVTSNYHVISVDPDITQTIQNDMMQRIGTLSNKMEIMPSLVFLSNELIITSMNPGINNASINKSHASGPKMQSNHHTSILPTIYSENSLNTIDAG